MNALQFAPLYGLNFLTSIVLFDFHHTWNAFYSNKNVDLQKFRKNIWRKNVVITPQVHISLGVDFTYQNGLEHIIYGSVLSSEFFIWILKRFTPFADHS